MRLEEIKSKYDACLEAITAVNTRLDDDIRRRNLMVDGLLDKVDMQLSSYKTKLEHFLHNRSTEVSASINELEQRLEQLQFALEATDVNSIRQTLQHFAEEQMKDVSARLDNLWARKNETDQEFKEKLNYWEEKSSELAQKEKGFLNNEVDMLKREIELLQEEQGDKSTKFQDNFRKKINDLKALLTKETEERENA